LARSFGLSHRASALAGVLALGVSSVYGPGIEGTFGYGLIPHQVGAPLVVFALGALVRLWLDPGARRVVPLAASVAGVLLVHPISAVILAVLGAVVIGLMEVEGAVVRRIKAVRARRAGRGSRARPARPGRPAGKNLPRIFPARRGPEGQ